MQTIETTFYGSTNTKPARVRARTPSGHTLWWPVDHSGTEHVQAAEALAQKLGWIGKWVCGNTRTGEIWVCLPTLPRDGQDTFTIWR